MARNARVSKVYAELRRILDPNEYSATDVLLIAQAVVDSFHQTEVEAKSEVARIGPLSLFSRPVDEAMDDGGWRILDYERRNGMVLWGDDDPIEFRLKKRRGRA